MNVDQAKKLSLPRLLARLGHEPVRVTKAGQEIWYASPFRTEKDASFHTSFLGGKWIWNDFGDIGGTVVDFAMRYGNYQSIRDALNWLEQLSRGNSMVEPLAAGAPKTSTEPSLFSFQQQAPEYVAEATDLRQLELIEARPITNLAIINYLTQERAIPIELAKRYLLEIRYRNTVNGKEFFAFGMENQSGGYEIRVASSKYTFKSALKARDITLVQGSSPERKIVNVFEGMTDFLSLLTMMKLDNLAGDSLIMHSLSSFQRAADFVQKADYQLINTFLDNNRPGQEGTEKFRSKFGEKTVPQNHLFSLYTDLNDALCANRFSGKTPITR